MARNEIKERRYRDIKAHARAAKEKNRYKAERIAKHFGVSVSTVRTIVRSASFKKYRADIEARNAARRQARETVAEVAPKPVQQELLTPTPEESPARTESSYAPERDFGQRRPGLSHYLRQSGFPSGLRHAQHYYFVYTGYGTLSAALFCRKTLPEKTVTPTVSINFSNILQM